MGGGKVMIYVLKTGAVCAGGYRAKEELKS